MTDVDSWEAVADGHGLASTGDALAAGLTKRDLAALVKDGRLVHLGRGWYSLPLLGSTDDVTRGSADGSCTRRGREPPSGRSADGHPRAITAPSCSTTCRPSRRTSARFT